MNSLVSLPEASTHAVAVDHIFYLLLALSGTTVILVFGLILLFAVRYRRGSKAKRGPMPEILSREFEIGWTLATLLTFIFLFWWASSADLSSLAAPPHAYSPALPGMMVLAGFIVTENPSPKPMPA